MTREEFTKLMEEEFLFDGKMFVVYRGETNNEKQKRIQAKMIYLERYYEAFNYLTEKALKQAFESHYNESSTFPRISHLKAFCARREPSKLIKNYYKRSTISPEIRAKIKKVTSGPYKYRRSDKILRDQAAMCQLRFNSPGHDWGAVLNLWRDENNRLPERKT